MRIYAAVEVLKMNIDIMHVNCKKTKKTEVCVHSSATQSKIIKTCTQVCMYVHHAYLHVKACTFQFTKLSKHSYFDISSSCQLLSIHTLAH